MKLCLDSVVFATRFPHLIGVTSVLDLDIETVTDWKEKLFPMASDEEFDCQMRTILMTIRTLVKEHFDGFKVDYPWQILQLPQCLHLFGLRTQSFILEYFQE